MIDINFDFNHLADQVGGGLALIGNKLGVAAPQLMEYGAKWEVAQGIGFLAIWTITLVIAIKFAIIAMWLLLKRPKKTIWVEEKGGGRKERVDDEDENVLSFRQGIGIGFIIASAVLVIGLLMSAVGNPERKLGGFVGAITRIVAPEASLVVDAVELFKNQ